MLNLLPMMPKNSSFRFYFQNRLTGIFIFIALFTIIQLQPAQLFGAVPNEQEGNEIVVSPNGDDSNTGTKTSPLKSIHSAIKKLTPGDTLTLLEGTYPLGKIVILNLRGNENGWITFRGEEGAKIILDGDKVNIGNAKGYPNNNGLIQIEDAAYIRVQNVHVKNSHRSGINIQDSHHIDVINCVSENSLSPGIAAWQRCEYIRVLGNTVINASDMSMSWEPYRGSEAPHEAISMAGPHYFEVAYNHVFDCQKEGIDVKETASFGIVHHNYIHDCARQGLYIDGWFGQLEDIEMHNNLVHGCEAGIAVSSEEGPNTKNLRIHHNLVYNNRASGIFFSRWGADNPREDVEVYNNTFYHNGWGPNFTGDIKYWLPAGGCYFYSNNLHNVVVRNNIFARNFPFEIGHTQRFKKGDMEEQNITIDYNLIQDINTFDYPVYLETWLKDSVYSITGEKVILAKPKFVNPEDGDFRVKSNSPAVNAGHPSEKYNDPDGTRNDIGAFPVETTPEDFWWKKNFPPKIAVNEL